VHRRTPTASAVARYLVSSLAAIAVIVVGSYFVLRSVTIREAERDTRERVILEGRLVQTGLTDGILTGDRAALARLDDVVQGQILGDSVVRVKLWTPDGRILYSDEPRLIGQRFELGEEERELFETGGADAELIARRLEISEKTVKSHLTRIFPASSA
jgi:two-component system, NarL family, sensor kinase